MNGDTPKFSLVKFKTLIRDERGPTHPTNEVLHTQEELDEYVASCQDKQKPKHTVAFPEERAVAVALGAQRHGGHVEIIAVVQETGGFVGMQHHVMYVEQVPHRPATDPITYPHHVIRVRGLGGIVSFREVPDRIGHSLHALTGALTGQGYPAAPPPTTQAVGEEGHATTLAVGEEGSPATTLAVGEEGSAPATLAGGEAGNLTTLALGEEHPPTGHIGEHPTTFAVGEEHSPTAYFGEHPTTLVVAGEEHLPTAHVGEHLTTLALGEETPGYGGGGGGRGPFG